MIDMWTLEQYPGYERRSRRLEKKHRRELEAVLDNLDTYLVFLNQGTKPMQLVKESFVRNEPMGIHAIDQSPLGKGYKELRLYVYPDTATSTRHVITVGDKNQQSRDINECCDCVKSLRKTDDHN